MLVKGEIRFVFTKFRYTLQEHNGNYKIIAHIKYCVPELRIKRKFEIDIFGEATIPKLYDLFLEKVKDSNNYFRERVLEDMKYVLKNRNDCQKEKDLLKLIKDSKIKFEYDIKKEEVLHE